MRRSLLRVVLLLLLAPPVLAAEVTEWPGLMRQPLQLTLASPGGVTLEALSIRTDGPGPFPLVLLTHGLPRDHSEIARARPESLISPAIVFAQHGYAVVIVMRRGYGRSGGDFSETLGPCGNRDYPRAGNAAADDLLGALAVVRTEPWVDPARILLVGQSMGGFAVLAASARNPPGVIGAVSFAGAVGSPVPDFVCQPDRLVEADRLFGQTAHVPSLWVFAANDHFFGPDLARSMFAAYTAGGAPATMVQDPAFGRDGHTLVFDPDGAHWWPQVAAFLATVRLPTDLTVTLPPLPPLPEPEPLNDLGRTAFRTYVASRSFEKAFATDPNGHFGFAYGQRNTTDAGQEALRQCQHVGSICKLYAIDNALAGSAAYP